MSDLPTLAQDSLMDGSQIIATLGSLFSERGIAVSGDGDRVTLITDCHHELKHHNPELLAPAPKTALQAQGSRLHFESAEHTLIGDATLLRFVKDAPPTPAEQVQLRMPNGLALTYGQIIALGGDFYGIPDQPICDGATPDERIQRFSAAFKSMAVLPASNDEAKRILDVMQKEIVAVSQAIKDGKPPHEVYDALGDTLSGEWNRITGGGSFISAFLPLGRYLKLSANSADHFGEWAVLAYIAGHTAALQQALLARDSGDAQQLELAYAMNAFADHYLSDRFSAGHLRVPRKQLAAVVTPSDLGSLIGRFMHDEDSKYGLNVHNAEGDQWRAYGDKRYFGSAGSQQVKLAVQHSANEVFETFLSGSLPMPSSYSALKYLPDLNATSQTASNFAALFSLDGDKVLRRHDVNDLNDTRRVDNWWGWSTYLLLLNYRPNTPDGYPGSIDAQATTFIDRNA